jgi:hypothetical protein
MLSERIWFPSTEPPGASFRSCSKIGKAPGIARVQGEGPIREHFSDPISGNWRIAFDSPNVSGGPASEIRWIISRHDELLIQRRDRIQGGGGSQELFSKLILQRRPRKAPPGPLISATSMECGADLLSGRELCRRIGAGDDQSIISRSAASTLTPADWAMKSRRSRTTTFPWRSST